MSKKINVLVFPCGSENALEIYKALRYSVHVNLIGASSVDDIGSLTYENYVGGLPNIKDNTFDKEFEKLITEKSIDIIFATHDTVIQFLAEKNLSAYLINGDRNTTQIARSKIKTYDLFNEYSWCPKYYTKFENIEFPVICKPDLGQGAQGVYKCDNYYDLKIYSDKVDFPVIVEYLPGNELTVDCFTDRNKKLIWIQPRTREKVKAGISMKSSYIKLSDEINNIANDINNNLKMRGPWFFQLKQDKNKKWKLLEISSRIAGSMVSQRAKGVNLPLMAIQDFMERDLITLPFNQAKYIERAIYTKVKMDIDFSKVYIDFDDTLILNNKVVIDAISFIYEMNNQRKEVILVTRHEHDLDKTLEFYKIPKTLFSKIIHINDNTPKSFYIKEKDAIFIDNHFLERKEVFENHKIPVFDVDYIEYFLR